MTDAGVRHVRFLVLINLIDHGTHCPIDRLATVVGLEHDLVGLYSLYTPFFSSKMSTLRY